MWLRGRRVRDLATGSRERNVVYVYLPMCS